jgi:hypothetical protein
MRTVSVLPTSCSRSVLRAASEAIMSKAAVAARWASSSCMTGKPNTAITASPMNFSTVPPWVSMLPRIVSK